MNPWSIVGDVVVGLVKARKMQQWLSLIFQILCSMVGTFLFVTGSTALASSSMTVGLASGMIASAVILVMYLRQSPLTKGMMFIFPAKEADIELDTNIQIIRKN